MGCPDHTWLYGPARPFAIELPFYGDIRITIARYLILSRYVLLQLPQHQKMMIVVKHSVYLSGPPGPTP